MKPIPHVFGALMAGLVILSTPAYGGNSDSVSTTADLGDTVVPVPSVKVFRPDGGRQCETGSGISIDESRRQLTDAGIVVMRAACGRKTGMQVLAVCGGSTNSVHVFAIDAADVDTALDLGFTEVTELPPAYDGTRWQPIECP